jgi:hypothetical protein
MLNRLARYAAVLDVLRRYRPESLIEIGSGSLGIGEFVSTPFIGVDITFEGRRCRTMRAVRASGAALPFATDGFDLGVCLDVLEHVDPSCRNEVIAEALRVVRRGLILGFPSGSLARDSDRGLAEWLRAKGVSLPQWLEEHLRYAYPDPDGVSTRAAAVGSCRTFGNENVGIHGAMMKWEMHPWLWVRGWSLVLRYGLRPLAALLCRVTNVAPYYRQIVVVSKRPKRALATPS